MLLALNIENIAVIKELSVSFSDGFSVMTGETGAGKSIIIDSLSLILGAKAQRELIRAGASSAFVSAVFSCLESCRERLRDAGAEPDENGEMMISRTITSDGRSSARINNKAVTQAALRDVGEILVSVYGQSEARLLSDRGEHIRLLDEYCGFDDSLSSYREAFSLMNKKRAEIDELKSALTERAVMTDILKYQIAEIEKARLSAPDEEEKLEKMRTKLRDLERIKKCSTVVYRALNQSETNVSAAYLLEKAAAALRQLAGVLDDALVMAERLDSYRYEIIDIAERANDILAGEDITNPDAALDRIEARLHLIGRLKGKYGQSIAEIKEFYAAAKQKLSDMDSGEMRVTELEREYKKLHDAALSEAAVLSDIRRKRAQKLSGEVCEALKFLDMPKARFAISVSDANDLNMRGGDEVEFLISTNPGDEAHELSKIASGGELSRVMLALRSTMAYENGTATVIFDEIDAGVSGGTSERVGIKLAETAKTAQVICVTHSAQIAAHSDHHYLIEKKMTDGRSESCVRELDYEGRVAETARIIGGISVTDAQRRAAREMIKKNS